MSIRLPLKAVITSNNNDEVGAGSVVGVLALPMNLPQDLDGVVVKFQASTVGGGVSAVFQTTDDGGTTWYDVARTSIVSNSYANANAEWLTVPVFGFGYRTATAIASTVATGSVIASGSIMGTTGSAGASTLGQKQYSGLPIMSPQARIAIIMTGNLTSSSILTTVSAQSQSATA